MKYIARKPFRYGTGVYMTGQEVPVAPEDVRMLQGQGKIAGPVQESAVVKPAENAMKSRPEPLKPQEGKITYSYSEPIKPDYNGMKVDQLKAICREKGLSTEGRKAELIERLEGE